MAWTYEKKKATLKLSISTYRNQIWRWFEQDGVTRQTPLQLPVLLPQLAPHGEPGGQLSPLLHGDDVPGFQQRLLIHPLRALDGALKWGKGGLSKPRNTRHSRGKSPEGATSVSISSQLPVSASRVTSFHNTYQSFFLNSNVRTARAHTHTQVDETKYLLVLVLHKSRQQTIFQQDRHYFIFFF